MTEDTWALYTQEILGDRIPYNNPVGLQETRKPTGGAS